MSTVFFPFKIQNFSFKNKLHIFYPLLYKIASFNIDQVTLKSCLFSFPNIFGKFGIVLLFFAVTVACGNSYLSFAYYVIFPGVGVPWQLSSLYHWFFPIVRGNYGLHIVSIKNIVKFGNVCQLGWENCAVHCGFDILIEWRVEPNYV